MCTLCVSPPPTHTHVWCVQCQHEFVKIDTRYLGGQYIWASNLIFCFVETPKMQHI